MGNRCCTAEPELRQMDSIVYSEAGAETIRAISENNIQINQVKSITVHESKYNGRAKPNAVSIALHLVPSEVKEKPVHLEAERPIQTASSIVRLPTNFKVEPLHFRCERKKASLEDKYLILEVIGRGNFGEVKKIKDKITGLYRALKVIHKNNCQKTDNFADEIEIIKKLVRKLLYFFRTTRMWCGSTSSIKMINSITW